MSTCFDGVAEMGVWVAITYRSANFVGFGWQ